ncbi:MAG: soluble lytic murein transglycosylase [bacterium]|nr:MAG: soluble lytic murein transglycosylase [bacterium]
MFLRSFALCVTLALASSLAYAQEQGSKRTFDNFDIAPTKTVQAEKTSEKPKEKVAEKSTETTKDNSTQKAQTTDKSVEKPTTLTIVEPPVTTDKSYKNKSTRNKAAVIKTVTPKYKGEGYWQDEKPATADPITALPPPKIYSEVRSSISENGRLLLTSDTVIVKPTVATKVVPVTTLTESTGDQELDEIIQNAAQKNKIDPRLILEVIRQESGFRTRAVSPKGASGLMQLIPSTARRFGVFNIFDRSQNVHAGATYLKLLLDMFDGDLDLALAGYNAGENAVIRYNYSIPPYRETRDYVRSITTRYRSRYHQITTAPIKEVQIVHQVPLTTFASENGRVILSNNY